MKCPNCGKSLVSGHIKVGGFGMFGLSGVKCRKCGTEYKLSPKGGGSNGVVDSVFKVAVFAYALYLLFQGGWEGSLVLLSAIAIIDVFIYRIILPVGIYEATPVEVDKQET